MRRIYTLKTCSTCVRILKTIDPTSDFEIINIKEQAISADDLDAIKSKVGSYEAIFSKKSQKYKLLGERAKTLKEGDFRDLMLQEYTYLKRPFILIDDEVFIGNSKETVEQAKSKMESIRS